jgi:hypothetical protein
MKKNKICLLIHFSGGAFKMAERVFQRASDWVWENDDRLREFKFLMMDYQAVRDSLYIDLIPVDNNEIPRYANQPASPVLDAKKAEAIRKWETFVRLVDKIVNCRYQTDHYVPRYYETPEGIPYADKHRVEICKQKLKNALLDGPFPTSPRAARTPKTEDVLSM